MKLNRQNIEAIKNYFADQPVSKAWLFGSEVREEAKANSDVDILVELDYTQRIGLKFVRMQLELEKLLNRKVDLVSEKGISKYIKPIVDEEKKLIYAR